MTRSPDDPRLDDVLTWVAIVLAVAVATALLIFR